MREVRSAAQALRLGLAVLILLLGSSLEAPVHGQEAPRLRRADGRSVFVIGASYQGPAERAWRGDYWAWWADDRFDPVLVDMDFRRASEAGLNTLRVFVQRELLLDVRREAWWKLDAVVALARKHGLLLLVTLGDYDEPRVAELARVAGLVATRYAGESAILGYDLRNEPSFWTVQSARYPDRSRAPLQSRLLVETYGERAAHHYIEAFRASAEGQRGPLAIPGWVSADDAYFFHNNWLLSYELAREVNLWASARLVSDIEFYASPDAAPWGALLLALDATYRAWLEPQLEAIRRADPTKPITVGHHEAMLAALPSNDLLDFLSPHRYPPAGPPGLSEHRGNLAPLRRLFPGKPIILGEFGHRTTELGEERAGLEETAVLDLLHAEGYGGGIKWMLTDTRGGSDTMGLYRMDGSPKPSVAAFRVLADQLAGHDARPCPRGPQSC